MNPLWVWTEASKLPGKLGQKIRESWNNDLIEPAMNNLTVRIQHIMKIMEDTCTNIAINILV